VSRHEKEFKEEAIRLCKVKDANKAEIARKLDLYKENIPRIKKK
jgi:transposase-like protein